jgi:hypothetical protein
MFNPNDDVLFSIGDIKNRQGIIKSYYGDGQYWVYDLKEHTTHLIDQSGIIHDYLYNCKLIPGCKKFKTLNCNKFCESFL